MNSEPIPIPEVDPQFEVRLTEVGALKDCVPDRTWFEESCRLSRRANEFAEEEKDRELMRILDGDE